MKLTGGKWSKGDGIAVLTLVAAILAVPGMPKLFHWDQPVHSQSQQPADMAKAPTTYVGRVTTVSGSAITRAVVLAFADQNVGQNIRVDSSGQFQIQVPGGTRSLRLVVNAPGFAEATVQANIHRTGPEELVLHPLPSARLRGTPNAAAKKQTQAPDPTNAGTNAPSQIMTNSPGAVQAGGNVTLLGERPPPDRILVPEDVVAAVAILKQAVPGSAVFFITFPTNARENGEIVRFLTELENVFAKAGWIPYRERNLQIGSVTTMESSGATHGEGIGCSAPRNPTPATTLAIRALAALHAPCTNHAVVGPEDFPQSTPSPFALYVSVGTRVVAD